MPDSRSQTQNNADQKEWLFSNLLVVLILSLPVLSFFIYWSQRQHRDRTSKGYAIQYPVVTHYPRPFLGEPDRRRRPDLGWGHFNNTTTDDWTPAKKQVEETAKRWENQSQCGVTILNVADKISSDFRRMQIVNNVRIGPTLWTFLISPFWKKEAGPYLLIVSGNAGKISNNRRLYQSGISDVDLPVVVARLGMAGHPIIAAIVNCGGREAQGNHPVALRAIGEGIHFAETHFAANAKKVVFLGESRGGSTALLWGANPLDMEYSAAAIFAYAPPSEYASLLAQPAGTYPAFAERITNLFGPVRPEPWKYDQQWLDLLALGKKVMAEGPDPARMRSHSPVAFIQKLRGKYLALGFGTHDGLIGPGQSFDFIQALEKRKIPFYVELVLGAGHTNFRGVSRSFDFYLRKTLKREKVTLPTGREWTVAEDLHATSAMKTAFEGSSDDFIWTIFPKITTGFRPNALYLGAPNRSKWSVKAVSTSTGSSVWIRKTGVVTNDYVHLDLPPPPAPGRYRWSFTLNGVTIPRESVLAAGSGGALLPMETGVVEEEGSLPEATLPGEDVRAFGCAWFLRKE